MSRAERMSEWARHTLLDAACEDAEDIMREFDAECSRLEAEVARLKQPAHVLAEAERLLREVEDGHAPDVHFLPNRVEVVYTDAAGFGATLADAYADLTGGQ